MQQDSGRLRPATRVLAAVALAVVVACVGSLSAAGAPPDNDNFAAAITLTGASGSTSGTNVEATTEAGEPLGPPALSILTAQTVWWKWTPTADESVTFAATSGAAPTIAIFTGPSLDALTEVASDNDSGIGLESRVFFNAVSGTTYYIQVGSIPDTSPGAFDLAWGPSSPPNDDFDDPTMLGADVGTLRNWNVGATVQPGEPNAFGDLGNTVWYRWTPAANGRGVVAAVADFNRATVAVYTGGPFPTLDLVVADTESVEFDLVGGTTYYIQIGGNDTSPGTFLLAWGLLPRPVNDDLADASEVTGGVTFANGLTLAATIEDDEPTDVTFGAVTHVGTQSVWYRWTPPATGPVKLSAQNTSIDDFAHAPLVQLFQGPATDPTFGDLEPLGVHDAVFNDPVDTLYATVEAGETYYIQVMADLTSEQDPDFEFQLTVQFDNDLFRDATEVFGAEGSIDGTTRGATFPEPSEPDPSGSIDKTVWYAWTSPGTGVVDVTVAADDYNAAAAIYTGTAPVNLVDVDSASGPATLQLSFSAVAGTTYFIQVGIFATAFGSFDLSWSLGGPANDDWADAILLTGADGSTSGSSVDATNEAGEPLLLDVGGYNVNTGLTVWWKWVAPAPGRYVFDTFGSDFDSVLGVFTGASVDALTPVVASDDAGDGNQSRVVLFASAATTYYFQVGGFGGNRSGAITLSWAAKPLTNDDFDDATPLDGDSGLLEGLNAGATLEPGEPDPEGFLTHSVWYEWTPSADGDAEFTFEANYLGHIAVYTGNDLDSLVDYDLDDSFLSLSVRLRGGTTYYIQVGTFDDDPDFFTLEWSLSPRPANDDYDDATVLDGNAGLLEGTTVSATLEAGEPDPTAQQNDGPLDNSVWFLWTPSESGTATVEVEPDFYPSLAAYEDDGEIPSLAALIAAEINGPVSFDVVAGETYAIQLGTDDDDTPGAFAFAWSLGSGPQHYVVTTTGDTVDDANCLVSSCTLRQAVNAANAGGGADEIEIPAGSYQLSAGFGALDVGNGMTITGAGARETTILGPPAANRAFQGDRVFDLTSAATPVLIEGVTLTHGTANTTNGCFGGNVRNSGELTLREVTVTDGAACSGGGLSNANGTMLVERSTVSGNQALFGGGDSGGIQNWGDGLTHHGVLTVTNSTITSNTARLGGGILSWGDTANTTSIRNSTIAFNHATNRGLGGFGGDGTFTVGATIVSDNTFGAAASNCSGTIVSLGSNLESGTDCSFTAGTDLRNTAPELGALGDNGGPTDTLALAATSLAVDGVSGECPPPATDQRGILRPQGLSCDIGAFELVPSTPAREISGSVRAAGGATLAGVLVRACLDAVCETTTSNSDGFFGFSELEPGVYTVRALPVDPALLVVQTDADVREQSVEGLVLRLATSGASSNDSGPTAFQVNGCVGGSLNYVATGDGTVLSPPGGVTVTDGAGGTPVDGVYTIDVSGLNVGHVAVLRLDITIACGQAPPETQTALLFTDPSGTVVDDNAAGAALAGATVTLLDAAGTPIPAGDPRLSPATSANPETSDARGAWGWDVTPGTYRVRATKTNCGTTESGPLVVTAGNPVTNVVLHLACATPPQEQTPPPGFPPAPPQAPPTLPDPVAGVNFNVVPISGTVLVNGAILPAGQQIPFGATIDATNGIVSITTIGPDGKPQTAYFYGGVFQLLLAADGVTNLVMRGGDFSVCPVAEVKGAKITKTKTKSKKTTLKRRVQGVQAKGKTESKTVVRALWGTGKGSFRTTGRFSSATVRGTLWYTADRCDGTYTKVTEGAVTVLDFPRKKVLIVRVGHSVLVRPK